MDKSRGSLFPNTNSFRLLTHIEEQANHKTHIPLQKVILLSTSYAYFLGLERTSHVRIFIDR